ncbi:hypothetical protein H8356DRAFT_1295877 [Neocallimastix lanati (nom. inval.)]|nr:hypothetical protein H8356DRAFT_1295877 [Neocallimastix sp. JGI-2020a]
MNVFKILNTLPLLENYNNDINEWIEELTELFELWNIKEQERRFILCKECVNKEIRYVLDELKEKNNQVPSLKEIKIALEEYLEITSSVKYWNLINLKINSNESISNFNYKYLRKYNDIDSNIKKLITVNNYVNSIRSRIYPCLRILEEEIEDIKEAIKYAEKNNKIMCFRCYELGHKAINCKHSFKELAELERTGILEINKRRNFIPGNHNNYNYKFNSYDRNKNYINYYRRNYNLNSNIAENHHNTISFGKKHNGNREIYRNNYNLNNNFGNNNYNNLNNYLNKSNYDLNKNFGTNNNNSSLNENMNTKKNRIYNNHGINYNMQGNKDVNIGNEINFNNNLNNNCSNNNN